MRRVGKGECELKADLDDWPNVKNPGLRRWGCGGARYLYTRQAFMRRRAGCVRS